MSKAAAKNETVRRRARSTDEDAPAAGDKRTKRIAQDQASLMREMEAAAEDKSPEDAAVRAKILGILKTFRAGALEEAEEKLTSGLNGLATAQFISEKEDSVIRALYEFTATYVYPMRNPTSSERIALVAVGGYGRGSLAPGSDVDLLFLLPYKQTPWGESVVEYMLYMLWDLGQKVGHATRSVDECIRLAKTDVTIRTALLEARYIYGDEELFESLKSRFQSDVAAHTGAEFVDAKLAERSARHKRMGESRYLVEPNIKDGKGGLRDLHTLYWIGKYLYGVDKASELVKHGVFTQSEYRKFAKAENFLWSIRCHLHFLTGRPEERLTFDVQPRLAERLGYTDHAGTRGVERFMKHYFLVAKDVGALTRIFCAVLEDQQKKKKPGLGQILPFFSSDKRRQIGDFVSHGGRINVTSADVFKNDPVNLLRIFRLAQKYDLDIHPGALQTVTRSLKLIDGKLRNDEEANRLFMEIMCSGNDPETHLRRMNEAGVFGRFVPDFGRIVSLMQFNMYHHYTVDEHLIRAIGILARIEAGDLAEDHPLANQIVHKVLSRQVLYMSVLLHDIAKGRPRDHSVVGEEIARRLCPRVGMSAAETESVAWLVRNHLVMSDFAQKRDIADPKTVADFAEIVKSPERLRLLLVLTVVDIRAVGPGVWNGWKGQLLRQLYYETESVLSGGLATEGRKERIRDMKENLQIRLSDWPQDDVKRALERHYDSYWIATDPEMHERHARLMREGEGEDSPLIVDTKTDEFQSITELTIVTPDHPGLFARVAGALGACGANVVNAKIFTTTDGMALDVFWVQDHDGEPYSDRNRLERLKRTLKETLLGEVKPQEVIASKQKRSKREQPFKVEPRVLIDNNASNTHTVIEVNGRDRPGLVYDLAWALYRLNVSIGSAHIATYGEEAVDTFYVKDLFGLKIRNESKLAAIDEALVDAISDPGGAERRARAQAEKKRGKSKVSSKASAAE